MLWEACSRTKGAGQQKRGHAVQRAPLCCRRLSLFVPVLAVRDRLEPALSVRLKSTSRPRRRPASLQVVGALETGVPNLPQRSTVPVDGGTVAGGGRSDRSGGGRCRLLRHAGRGCSWPTSPRRRRWYRRACAGRARRQRPSPRTCCLARRLQPELVLGRRLSVSPSRKSSRLDGRGPKSRASEVT